MKSWLLAPMHLSDLYFLDEFQRLQNVGNVIQPPDSGLHDGIWHSNAVNDFGGNVQINFGMRLKKMVGLI